MSIPTRFEWERAVRQLPIRPPVCKLVALVLATYADGTGANAHPGEDRLAHDCGIQVRATRGHLATLRRLGLIERTFEGSSAGRRQLADTYRLAMPPDILARLGRDADDLYSPGDHRHPGAGVPDDHRHVAAGASGPITGTSMSDHRHPDADHRHDGAKITGTTVPPTTASTKDADHLSPPLKSAAASTTGRAHARPQQRCSLGVRLADDGSCCDEHAAQRMEAS